MNLSGVWTALITPFKDNKVDEEALRSLVESQIAGGVAGLVPCGTTGESAALSHQEHHQVVKTVVAQAKRRVPVFAGAGTASTQKTVELGLSAKQAGADGLLVVCPYYNRPSERGLEAHFRRVAQSVKMPIILYNIPRRTGVDLEVDTLVRLQDVPEIVGVKEASGNVQRTQDILERCGERYAVLAGDDWLVLATAVVGATGVVSVSSNVKPSSVSEVLKLCAQGRYDEARALHFRLLPLHRTLFIEPSPGPVKVALSELKQITFEVREPILEPTGASIEKIREVLHSLEDLG